MRAKVKCATCPKMRSQGGSQGAQCRDCWLKAHKKPDRYTCKTPGCTREVSGPGRSCGHCHAAKMRAQRGSAKPTAVSAATSTAPAWWVCSPSEFSKRHRERLPHMTDVRMPEPIREAFEESF